MKCVLALSFFLAAASAGAIHGLGVLPAAGHVVATPTSSQYHAQDVLGQYSYGYSGPLSAKHEARSFDGVTRGGYSYVDGHGLVQSAEYVSDPANGFRVAATNLPVGPGVPAPAVHAAVVAAPVAHSVYAAPIAHAVVAAPVAHAAVGQSSAVITPHSVSQTAVSSPVTAHSSLVTPDGIVSSAAAGDSIAHSVTTAAGTVSTVSHPVAPLAHALAHPVAHSLVHPYALPLIHRRKRGLGLVALGHVPASTAPLVGHGVAVAAPAVHAYAAHAYAPAAVSYSSSVVAHAAPAVVAHAYAAPAVVAAPVAHAASTRYHAQDVLGQYSYGYNDGVSAKQEVRTHDGVTRGAYSYVDPRGVLQSVHYAADGHGFRAAASNIL